MREVQRFLFGELFAVTHLHVIHLFGSTITCKSSTWNLVSIWKTLVTPWGMSLSEKDLIIEFPTIEVLSEEKSIRKLPDVPEANDVVLG